MHNTEKQSQSNDAENDDIPDPEPRWPVLLADLAVGGLFLALPENLSLGPRWLLLALVVIFQIPLIFSRRHGHHKINRILGHVQCAVITAFMIFALVMLVHSLPSRKEAPIALLHSAIALWISNVIVFASWYWWLDAGGPHKREIQESHTDGSFLFPQMTLDDKKKAQLGEESWSPHFVDYLFLAFNTSTAFSPTDTMILSRWAKVIMMVQSSISLAIIALLAARSVNIL